MTVSIQKPADGASKQFVKDRSRRKKRGSNIIIPSQGKISTPSRPSRNRSPTNEKVLRIMTRHLTELSRTSFKHYLIGTWIKANNPENLNTAMTKAYTFYVSERFSQDGARTIYVRPIRGRTTWQLESFEAKTKKASRWLPLADVLFQHPLLLGPQANCDDRIVGRHGYEVQSRWWNVTGKKFRFLDLPAELRLMIYAQALGLKAYPRRMGNRQQSRPNTAIYVLCKQVCFEVLKWKGTFHSLSMLQRIKPPSRNTSRIFGRKTKRRFRRAGLA